MSVYSAHVDTFARDNLPPRDQWPDLIFTFPELQYPDRLNCIVELLDTKVQQGYGDLPAIFSADGVLTYAQMQAQVDKVAHVLTHDMGLVPGNRVLLRGANNAMMAICWFAVAKAGLIVVATMHFHRDILAACDCFPKSILHMAPDDICIGTPPLAFTFGLGALLIFPLRVGAATILLEKLTPESLLSAIRDYRATIAWSTPLFYRQMADIASRFDLSTLRQSVSAGEWLPVSTRTMWREAIGIEIVDVIGSTEMLHIFIASAGADIRPGATGK